MKIIVETRETGERSERVACARWRLLASMTTSTDSERVEAVALPLAVKYSHGLAERSTPAPMPLAPLAAHVLKEGLCREGGGGQGVRVARGERQKGGWRPRGARSKK